jgi:hypothetical protein
MGIARVSTQLPHQLGDLIGQFLDLLILRRDALLLRCDTGGLLGQLHLERRDVSFGDQRST